MARSRDVTNVEVNGVVVAATRKIDLTEPAQCKGTDRVVSYARRKRAIFTTEWRTWCPHCLKSAPFSLAERMPDGGGYFYRYLPHPPAQVDDPEEES